MQATHEFNQYRLPRPGGENTLDPSLSQGSSSPGDLRSSSNSSHIVLLKIAASSPEEIPAEYHEGALVLLPVLCHAVTHQRLKVQTQVAPSVYKFISHKVCSSR
eukprot:767822-Hanusia_phi.AAC.3